MKSTVHKDRNENNWKVFNFAIFQYTFEETLVFMYLEDHSLVEFYYFPFSY